MNPNYELYRHHKLCYSILQQCRDKLNSETTKSGLIEAHIQDLAMMMAHHRTEYRKYNGGVS